MRYTLLTLADHLASAEHEAACRLITWPEGGPGGEGQQPNPVECGRAVREQAAYTSPAAQKALRDWKAEILLAKIIVENGTAWYEGTKCRQKLTYDADDEGSAPRERHWLVEPGNGSALCLAKLGAAGSETSRHETSAEQDQVEREARVCTAIKETLVPGTSGPNLKDRVAMATSQSQVQSALPAEQQLLIALEDDSPASDKPVWETATHSLRSAVERFDRHGLSEFVGGPEARAELTAIGAAMQAARQANQESAGAGAWLDGEMVKCIDAR